MKRYVLSIDLGATNIECGLVDKNGNVRVKKSYPTGREKGGETVLSNILSVAREVVSEGESRGYRIIAVSIGTPGAVDQKTGRIIGGAPNIPGWKGIALVPALKEEFSLPTFASNDVTLYALGEAMFGAGKGKKDIVCLTLGTGIGGGIVIGGRIYRGAIDGAAEVGHITVKLDGRKCKCGSFGCLERYASATAIAELGRRSSRKNRKSLIRKLAGGDEKRITAKVVFDAAKQGDRTAKEIVGKVGWYLGAGIANLINILNPEMVIIAGGVAGAGKMLLEITRKSIETYATEVNRKGVEITLGKLKTDAGVIGAAALAWEEMKR